MKPTATRLVPIVLVAHLTAASPAAQTAEPQDTAASGAPQREAQRPLRFCVIGDFGDATNANAAVAELVRGLDPAFVVTLGDNNYDDGAASTIDANIGQHYHRFIHPYLGAYGPGADRNRFFPCLGNHDWVTPGAQPYFDYFTLPGNERYYEMRWGPVHLFVLDSDGHEPDGNTAFSPQALWLQNALAASDAPFKLVTMHHPPFSSGLHGDNWWMRWPFATWGADAVLGGHDHHYERLSKGGVPHFVNGLGGRVIYPLDRPQSGSAMRFDAAHGAMLVEVSRRAARFEFRTRHGIVIDRFTLPVGGIPLDETALVAAGSTWRYLDDGSDAGTAWIASAFDDSAWASGPAQLGYGEGDEATTVSFGGDPENKFVTTYFRHELDVTDPGQYGEVELRLLRDDGAVVYLNGVEVMRENLPAGPIDYLTLAPQPIGGGPEDTWYGARLDPGLLVRGTNVLAVEVHQNLPTSSDKSFDLELVGRRVEPLVERGAVWHYLDDGTEPPADWTTIAFDEGAWEAGPAQLGYGEGDEATVVDFGPDPANRYITTHFRHRFTVADPSAHRGLLLRTLWDDGVVVYVNGEEVYRSNLPPAPTDSTTRAEYPLGADDEGFYFETFVAAKRLVAGDNVVAVEIHQRGPMSGDLSFDLELVGLP